MEFVILLNVDVLQILTTDLCKMNLYFFTTSLSAEMSICIGIKANRDKCARKTVNETKWCTIHNPSYVKKKISTKKVTMNDRKVLEMVAEKLNIEGTYDDWIKEDILIEKANPKNQNEVRRFIECNIKRDIRKYATADTDLAVCANKESLFPRKAWMIISWHLRRDLTTYHNLAFSCRKLYKVFVEDKVRYFIHPLKHVLLSPLVFMMPVYRLLQFTPPPNLDKIAIGQGLPTIERMSKIYDKKHGVSESEAESTQRKTEMIISLVKEIIKKNLDDDDEFIENVEGGGIFEDVSKPIKIELGECNIPVKVFRVKGASYLVVKCHKKGKMHEIEVLLSHNLRSPDGKTLLQLLKIEGL